MMDGMSKQGFGKADRVRKSAEFDRVYQSKAYSADDVLVVRGISNGQQRSRLGMSVSRKVGNAVVRNRWKRLIREAFRTQRDSVPTGFDFVVRPRRGAAPDHAAIRRSLPALARRVANRLRNGK